VRAGFVGCQVPPIGASARACRLSHPADSSERGCERQRELELFQGTTLIVQNFGVFPCSGAAMTDQEQPNAPLETSERPQGAGSDRILEVDQLGSGAVASESVIEDIIFSNRPRTDLLRGL
jgi:hypothetical protein